MSTTDSTGTIVHSYPIYGRQFKSYRWYKPVFVGILFAIFYIIFSVVLAFATALLANGGDVSVLSNLSSQNILVSGYDEMDLANPWQSVMSLGGLALMIPALWLASLIVRDRPFSSYQSARGGWSRKVFWKAFPVGIVCATIPIIIDELFIKHQLANFDMRFTLASFAVVTILAPLQCIAEEYIFRGLLMQTFGSWFRLPVIAVILQTVIFAAIHPYDMLGKIGIVFTGAIFALTAWIGKGIEVSSALHVCNNLTIFYLQGMNLAEITTKTTMHDFILEVIIGTSYLIIIFIINKRHNWFSKIRHDDAAAWNRKIDDKIARKEAKANAKAEKKAAKNAPIGTHEESVSGKHFKQ